MCYVTDRHKYKEKVHISNKNILVFFIITYWELCVMSVVSHRSKNNLYYDLRRT